MLNISIENVLFTDNSYDLYIFGIAVSFFEVQSSFVIPIHLSAKTWSRCNQFLTYSQAFTGLILHNVSISRLILVSLLVCFERDLLLHQYQTLFCVGSSSCFRKICPLVHFFFALLSYLYFWLIETIYSLLNLRFVAHVFVDCTTKLLQYINETC